ncbi:MAG: glycosyltransferase [Phycisphaeraceae bacterium]|nr:glycosyltransferase [Phycisphaeraceae bacterium]
MVWLWLIAASVGTGLSLALLVYWSFAIGRILDTSRKVPTARAGLGLAAARPLTDSVCVVVPAHNEAHAIAGVIRSLRKQDHPQMRVVIALDRCTDGTADVARGEIGEDARFRLLEIQHCPQGWAGKVHAVWSGVTASDEAGQAEYLLFIDADTELDPGCVSATAALMRERQLDMLSLLSTLTYDRWFEILVQPAASLELLRQYPILQANRDDDRRPFANGQFMMFRASSYRAIETHESVKDELLEDLALARRISQARMRAGVYVADGMVRCRMYESWSAFKKGWKRIYTEAARRRAAKLRRASFRVVFPGAVLPIFAVLAVVSGAVLFSLYDWETLGMLAMAVGGIAIGVHASALTLAYRAGGAPVWSIFAYPIGAVLTARILRQAASDLQAGRPTSWGGIEYARTSQ